VSFIDVKHFGYMTWTMNAWTDRSSMSWLGMANWQFQILIIFPAVKKWL
jgi:hypothetical protein